MESTARAFQYLQDPPPQGVRRGAPLGGVGVGAEPLRQPQAPPALGGRPREAARRRADDADPGAGPRPDARPARHAQPARVEAREHPAPAPPQPPPGRRRRLAPARALSVNAELAALPAQAQRQILASIDRHHQLDRRGNLPAGRVVIFMYPQLTSPCPAVARQPLPSAPQSAMLAGRRLEYPNGHG